MLVPTAAMLAIVFLICLVVPSIMYIKNRKRFVDILDDSDAEEKLRKAGYCFLVLKKYRNNVYALRPGARSKVEVRLYARHETSTNAWNMIEYNFTVYGQKGGRHIEVFQCDWTQERQQKLVEFIERYNFATLPDCS